MLFRQEFAAVDQATPVTGYDVVVCERCGGGYADGIPDQAGVRPLLPRHVQVRVRAARRRGVRVRLSGGSTLIADIIAPHLPSPDVRILDVGCASGRLLANIRDRGFANVTGLDPSPGVRRRGRAALFRSTCGR